MGDYDDLRATPAEERETLAEVRKRHAGNVKEVRVLIYVYRESKNEIEIKRLEPLLAQELRTLATIDERLAALAKE